MSVDFISTNATDTQTVRCARLLTAVIAQAIIDAGHQPTKTEKKEGHEYRARLSHSSKAIMWLFEPGTTFEQYANLTGLNPTKIREALLSRVPLREQDKMLFSEQARRNIQIRHRRIYATYKND